MKNNKLDILATKFKNSVITPFWMWNDMLNNDKLYEQLVEIKSKGINCIIIHPRFGIDEYLTEKWFRHVGFILEMSKKHEMNVLIYDELNWPSGYAGGKLLSNNPEYRAQNIALLKKNKYKIQKSTWHPAYSDGYYIDVLNEKAVKTFLDLTYDEYWKRFKSYFGNTLLGFFTDEPGFYNNFCDIDKNTLPWSSNIPSEYKKMTGKDIYSDLKSICYGIGNEAIENRVNYWELVGNTYSKSYFKQIQDWCHNHNVLFIGHLLAEESLIDTAKTQSSFFKPTKYLDFSGYDLLTSLEQKAVIPARLAYSAKKYFNLYGVTAETFGIFGWDLSIKDMFNISKWQFNNNLDIQIPHALYYSLRGNRINDCPPSFFERKYWSNFKKYVSLLKSISNNIGAKPLSAIYYPIESIWSELHFNNTSLSQRIDESFKLVSYTLQNLNINFDYLSSEFIDYKILKKYKYLFIPETTVLPLKTLKFFKKFIQNRNKLIIAMNHLPSKATKTKDQPQFEILLSEIKSKIIIIETKKEKSTNINLQVKRNIKKEIINFIKVNIKPIWLARIIRIAKMLGIKKSFDIYKPTGLESKVAKYYN